MSKPRLLVFASGSATGGGSGFQNLVECSRKGTLRAEIVGVVSNHIDGGVRNRAKALDVPFFHFTAPFTAGGYQGLASNVDFVALSGWLKPVRGLDPKTTFNIHPGPLPRFGGKGMYGHHVHAAVLDAYNRGLVSHSAVTMHFVTEEYDKGPEFFTMPVPIRSDDTVETLAERVNRAEHVWQPAVTDAVVQGAITWDGKNADSLRGSFLYQVVGTVSRSYPHCTPLAEPALVT